MEQIPIITESVQYGVIGICIMLIIAWCTSMIALFRYCFTAGQALLQQMKSLEGTIQDLSTQIERLTIRSEFETRLNNHG